MMLGALLSMAIVLYAGNGMGSTQGYLVVLAVMVFIAGFAIGLGSVSYIGIVVCSLLLNLLIRVLI